MHNQLKDMEGGNADSDNDDIENLDANDTVNVLDQLLLDSQPNKKAA